MSFILDIPKRHSSACPDRYYRRTAAKEFCVARTVRRVVRNVRAGKDPRLSRAGVLPKTTAAPRLTAAYNEFRNMAAPVFADCLPPIFTGLIPSAVRFFLSSPQDIYILLLLSLSFQSTSSLPIPQAAYTDGSTPHISSLPSSTTN